MRLLRAVIGLLLVPLVVTSLGACTDDGEDPPPNEPSLSGAVSLPQPEPSAGRQLVGFGEVMVEVPATWTVHASECFRPRGDAVVFDDRNAQQCRTPPRFSALELSTGEHSAPGAVLQTVNGLEVERSDGCHDTGFCIYADQISVFVPSSGEVLYLRGPAGAMASLDMIASSIKPIPEGYTALPYIGFGGEDERAVRRLEAAGLVANLPDVDFPHYVVGTQPSAGAVVPLGTEVEIQVGDG